MSNTLTDYNAIIILCLNVEEKSILDIKKECRAKYKIILDTINSLVSQGIVTSKNKYYKLTKKGRTLYNGLYRVQEWYI